MQPFPPPSPDQVQPEPTNGRPGSRRRLAIAAVAAGALGVGGVIVGAQLVSADDDPTEDTATPTSEPDESEPDDVVPEDEPADDEAPADDEPTDDELPNLDDLGDLGDLGTMFDDISTCLWDELPEITGDDFGEFPSDGDWDGAFDDLLGGAVTVLDPSDDLLSFFDFGDGDGTITITQTDGEIEITTDGDVNELDDELSLDVPDFEIPEIDPEIGQAVEDCLPLLGEGEVELGDMLEDLLGDGGPFAE